MTPFGQLPMLCVDGTVISQSRTIARYVAVENGLAGKNAMENAQMDEIVDALSDATELQYNAYLFEKDETKKAQLQKDFNEKTLPTLIKNIDRRLTELADQSLVKANCKLNALMERVASQPNIKKW